MQSRLRADLNAVVGAPKEIIVVGASLAGLRACEDLRRRGFDGRITLVGAERHLPYDRPPLSKEVLRGEWEPDRIALRREGYEQLDLILELGRRAVSLDTAGRRLELDDGRRLTDRSRRSLRRSRRWSRRRPSSHRRRTLGCG